MSYKIKALTDFEKELKRLSKKYKSLGLDITNLLTILRENPTLGTPIGKNLYKLRLAISSKNQGKSGGARAVRRRSYYLFSSDRRNSLFSLYLR